MSELVRKPKAIEGEVVKPLEYGDITAVTNKLIYATEVANWHEKAASDAEALLADTYGGQVRTKDAAIAMHAFLPPPSVPEGFDYLKMVNDALNRMIGVPIEPTSIDKATLAIKFDAMPSAKPPVFAEPYRPSLWQRIYGYTANPVTCGHHHSRFRTRWICADCGSDL